MPEPAIKYDLFLSNPAEILQPIGAGIVPARNFLAIKEHNLVGSFRTIVSGYRYMKILLTHFNKLLWWYCQRGLYSSSMKLTSPQ